MTCEELRADDGTHLGFMCNRGKRRPTCSQCKSRAATKLCDYPLRGRKAGATCDRNLCDRCVVEIGPDGEGDTVDYCPAHARMTAELPFKGPRLIRDPGEPS